VLAALLCGYAATAAPSTAEFVDSVISLQEVSVTAIKEVAGTRSSQTMSRTAIDGRSLERLNIEEMKKVSALAPNFYMPDYGSRMTSSIYVRGLGARIDQSVVGLNVDNVPFLNKNSYDFDVTDIARIEVLRGPQSTLYGRNTMGGVVNIYTLSPMAYHGLRALLEYGSRNTMKISAGYYFKVGGYGAMSVTADYGRSDGFFRNLYNGLKIDGEQHGGVRWKSVWRISDAFMVENTAAVQLNKQGGYPYMRAGESSVNYNDTCFYNRAAVSDGLTWRYVGKRVELSGITSFQYLSDNMTLDQDFTTADYFTLTQRQHEWAITQDVVAKGHVGSHYRWMGGLFGFYKRMNMNAPVTFKRYGISELIEKYRNAANSYYPVSWSDDSFVLGSRFVMPTYGAAIYHNSTFEYGRFELSAGLRLDVERSQMSYNSDCSTGYVIYDMTGTTPIIYDTRAVEIHDTGDMHKSFVELLPKVGVSYRLPMPSASNVYVSVSKGYKAGGYNTQMFSDVLQQRLMGLMGLAMNYKIEDVVSYKPEKSWNYEVGAHIACLNERIFTDIAAFYIDCRNQQMTKFPAGMTTGRIMANAGRTRSRGIECQVGARPNDRWQVDVSYGFTDARFMDFDDGKQDYAGRRIPYAPKHTLFAGATYTQPVVWSWLQSVSLNAHLRGVGSIYWDDANTVSQPFYTRLGASLKFMTNHYSVDLWAENIIDTHFSTFYFVSIGNTFLQQGKPRRFGVTLRLNFAT
jgi:outer membrane receptor protein involved in Fe transport